MKKTVLAVLAAGAALLAAVAPVPAEVATGIVVWKASDLLARHTTMPAKVNEKKVAVEDVGKFGNHSALVAHRQGDGEAEVHDSQADIFVVQSGQATLVLGGEVVDGREIAPGEIRGPSIKGGQRYPIGKGDIAHIPARTAHQLLLPAGQAFTYFVIKVDTP